MEREQIKDERGLRMNQNTQYDFCPRCGALMYNGVCQSCEYTANANGFTNQNMNTYVNQNVNPNMNTYVNQNANPNMTPNYNQGYNPYQNSMNMGAPMQPKKKKTGLIIGIIVGCVVALLVLVLVVVFGVRFLLKSMDETKEDDYSYSENYEDEYDYNSDDEEEYVDEEEYIDEEDDTFSGSVDEDGLIDLDGDGIGDLEYESGLEGLSAEYYPVITDYIRYDLSYSVTFLEYTDDEGDVSCFYPYLKGDHEFIPYYNQAFYMIAEGAEELADEYDCEASSIAYVTYMDEDIFSVVFIEMYSFDDGSYYEDILCYSFDMKNGELLDFALTDTSDEFLTELEDRCLEQSTSDATYLFSEYSKDELRDIFENEEYALVAFYTPLGMEIGITYDGYWCCATFKDYEKYITIVEDDTSEF